ncbi:hypothetical protein [Tsuneonella troitsensis]|uniref:hypothetical protein n=1 Tax=Tsuneonella troitsensis TaxID=292222 RepID=UPI00070BB284|nr:hypothetical protein [Tsuneonella troitsensis]
MSGILKLGIALAATILVWPTASQGAGEPWKRFWLLGGLHQGMTEDEFNAAVVSNKAVVTNPIPNSITKGVKIGGTDYWVMFCNGELTYASWILNNNDELLKSMSERVNQQGFKLSNYKVASGYNDAAKTDNNGLEMRFENPEREFSVTYNLFPGNGQITLQDSRYDDSFNCAKDAK